MDSLNTILNSGTYGENVSRHNDNNSKIKQAITTLENVAIANKGYFDTLASLQAAFPSPKAGNIAYVANVASSTGYYIYNVVSGVWTATTTEAPAVGVAISNYAQHGYSSSPKTLKQVEDEIVQLSGEMVKDMLLSESFMPQSATYTDGLINSPFNVIWVDGATGVVAVTRNSDNLATNIVATHILGDVTKTITCEITRDADGNVTNSTITII